VGDKTDRATGKVKEATGRATGNRRLKTKGRDEQAKGNLKQTGKAVKRAAKKT
jgi:uncharacterized protein YjbJ (UPF0337 family)